MWLRQVTRRAGRIGIGFVSFAVGCLVWFLALLVNMWVIEHSGRPKGPARSRSRMSWGFFAYEVDMIVKRPAPLSFAKVAGVLYVLIGFLFGGLISMISILGVGLAADGDEGRFLGMLFGAGAVVVLPIFYGVLGFVTTLIGAALYNAIASVVGGVEIEVQQGPGVP